MSWLARFRSSRPGAAPVALEPEPEPTPAPVIESHRSPALEEIVATARRRGGTLAVLDLGAARPSTFLFLEPLCRRLGVADLEAGLGRGHNAELSNLLPEPDTPWDLVLVWDLLDRLERPVAKRLAKRLESQLAPGAMIHLLASRSAEIDAVAPTIQLADEHTLTIRREGPAKRPGPGWTQRELSTWVSGCEPGPGALHKTGFVEVLLRRR